MPTALNTRTIIAFAAIYIIWGTTYLAVRIGISTIPPFIMGTMRYSLAGIIFLGYAAVKKEKIFNASVLRNIILGAVMQTGGQAMLFWCEKFISSGFTAILVGTEPIWFILLDKPQWKNCFRNKLVLLGVAVGFIGIVVLFQNLLNKPASIQTGQSLQLAATVVALLSAVLWTGGSLYFKYNKTGGSLYLNLGWQLVGGVLSCIIVAACTHEFSGFAITNISLQSWLSVLYLAIAGSIIALSCYNWLLTQKPSAVVGTYAYINPMIAVLVGYLLASEHIFTNQVIGMFIILFSAYLINKADWKTEAVA